MAKRSAILPICIMAIVLFGGLQCFVGNSIRTSTPTHLRSGVASRAIPMEAVDAAVSSSVATALSVQTAGWWANIFFVCIPCGFLMTLYLQSERSKLEE
mmetsp:Transcript_19418/g.45153  ORF Transcript_19418/g.45153 Transcript_19418/m.45153 type:complete len:99 (+) Transcript_19418:82-378(+)